MSVLVVVHAATTMKDVVSTHRPRLLGEVVLGKEVFRRGRRRGRRRTRGGGGGGAFRYSDKVRPDRHGTGGFEAVLWRPFFPYGTVTAVGVISA